MKSPLRRFPPGEVYGVLASFDGAAALYRACEQVRDAGYRKWDAHSPYPIHGLERAMGVRPSRLPFVVLATGLSGAAGGMLLQWWVHTEAYPLVISGKPLFSWPAFVPVTFELGVLAAAFGAVLGMLLFNRLPTYFHPLFSCESFERVGVDGMFISIEAADPQFEVEETSAFLRTLGATHVEIVRSSDDVVSEEAPAEPVEA